ncbi:MAG TPA: hypothetical protein PKE30_19775 [Niabella sp.]|nr:hypothetical protein [Niabella sp.]
MRTVIALQLLLWTLFVPGAAHSQPPAAKKPAEQQVGRDDASTIFAYYNTTPESPDGKTIAYVRCKAEPVPGKPKVPAELWVCDRDLQQHRKVADIAGINVHDGAEAQWVDNDRIALFDDRKIRIIHIRSGKDLLQKELLAAEIGHDTHNGKVLYSICEGKVPGEPAIYELDCNTQQVRTVLKVKDLATLPVPSFMNKDSLYPLMQWQLSHLQYSPDGKKICFRIEMGPGSNNILLGICDVDGSNLKAWMKPLHFVWYDNETIAGHYSNAPDGKRPEPKESRYTLNLWDLNGNMVKKMMTPLGNHLAISPDKTRFVSETFYQRSPVVVTLYGLEKGPLEICRFDPFDITWEKKFHVNPSFSRDGKRVYYSRPLNEKYNGTFFIEID